mgnify:CR=1 FL=1
MMKNGLVFPKMAQKGITKTANYTVMMGQQ